MRFVSRSRRSCSAIGSQTDVPAGTGVGGREIGYLFGSTSASGTGAQRRDDGQGPRLGRPPDRPEATGYGSVYFAEDMLATPDDALEGKTCLVERIGNVA